ncbi:MAG: hypothetical protein AAGA54_23100 [Myxococcota bacterium]
MSTWWTRWGATALLGLTLATGCATAGPAVGSSALDVFDGKTLAYTYGNGKYFENTFEGNVRTTVVKRGTLHETVIAQHLGEDRYLMVWRDDNMGMIVQVIDLGAGTVRAAVPLPDGPQVWVAEIERFD